MWKIPILKSCLASARSLVRSGNIDALEILYPDDDYDGFQLVGITYSGEVGYLGVITANNLVNVHGFKHFASVKEFINSYEGN